MSNTYFNISDKLSLYEFDGMLDKYGDATAAYSLRKLRTGYTGNAIRVRRSSDNTERDMGFYDNELDTVALLDWVNTDYIKAQWDFSVGGTNLSTLNLPQSNGESVAGENDAAKFTLTGGLANHYCYGGPTIPGQTFTVTGKYYIPSTNVSCDAIRISGGSNEFEFFNTLDQWAEFEVTAVATVTYAIFRAADGTNTSVDGDGDVFYLKDVVITQNTADGLVHTWYDQSANANHAVQNTDSAQPKIVDAGSLLTENGNPSIVFDGVDDFLKSTLPGIPEGTDHTVSAVTNHKGAIGCYFETGKLYNGRYFNADNTGYYSALSINGTYNYISSLNANFTTNQQVNVISVATNNATNYDVYLNNTSETGTRTSSVPSGTDETYIGQGNRPGSEKWWTGDIQEIVFWSVNQTNSVDNIEQNTNTYYSIY